MTINDNQMTMFFKVKNSLGTYKDIQKFKFFGPSCSNSVLGISE